ncbi:MAG: hypothetical protein JSS32_09245 [Verrucomicrobia bacterium]|nr:hypothetical protein [Verrucomicrobiota bacterium]
MMMLKLLLPIIASVQNPQAVDEIEEMEEQQVAVLDLEDPAEIFEVEFNEEEEGKLDE